MNTFDREEEEYLCFLEEFGHIDFTLLNFLPQIRTVEEFQEFRQKEILNSTRFVKQSDLLANNPNMPKKKESSRRDKKWSQAKYDREHGKGTPGDDGQTFGATPDGAGDISNGGPRQAERFDFTMNQIFYLINMEMDEFGERVVANYNEPARIITKDGIHRNEETVYSEDENGNPVIPPK